MHEVKVDRMQLLKILKANRDKHVKDYEEAYKGYIKRATAELEDRLKNFTENPNLVFNLPKPPNYKKQYDRVIEMVEMSVDDDLVLSSSEFAQFVMDDWNWKESFTSTAMMYAGA